MLLRCLHDLRALPFAASNDEFYGASAAELRETPTEAEWQIPALLASLSRDCALAQAPQPRGLGLPLYGYQRQALRFLLDREMPSNEARLSPLWSSFKAADGAIVYCCIDFGTVTLAKPLCPVRPLLNGGILADSMGLGKTAMLAALILAHPFRASVQDESRNGELMAEAASPPRRIKATLVVVTAAIESQWCAELQRWAPGLSVLRYPASLFACPDEPAVLSLISKVDVVVVTYEHMADLRRLLASTGRGQVVARALCLRVSWWRVVLDEAQAVFNASCAAAKSVSWLWRVFSAPAGSSACV